LAIDMYSNVLDHFLPLEGEKMAT